MNLKIAKPSYYFALVIVVLALVLCWWFYLNSVTQSSISASITTSVPKLAKEQREILQAFNPPKAEQKAAVVSELSEAQRIAFFDEWSKRHGYHGEEEEITYTSYSKSQLEDLGKQGDLIALQLLSDIALREYKVDEAMRYDRLGVIYGSTPALRDLAAHVDPRFQMPEQSDTEEKRRPRLLETAALIMTMAYRDDPYGAADYLLSYKRSYDRTYKTNLTFSKEEGEYVFKRAQELYKEFEQERHKLGLGDFEQYDPLGFKDATGIKFTLE